MSVNVTSCSLSDWSDSSVASSASVDGFVTLPALDVVVCNDGSEVVTTEDGCW